MVKQHRSMGGLVPLIIAAIAGPEIADTYPDGKLPKGSKRTQKRRQLRKRAGKRGR